MDMFYYKFSLMMKDDDALDVSDRRRLHQTVSSAVNAVNGDLEDKAVVLVSSVTGGGRRLACATEIDDYGISLKALAGRLSDAFGCCFELCDTAEIPMFRFRTLYNDACESDMFSGRLPQGPLNVESFWFAAYRGNVKERIVRRPYVKKTVFRLLTDLPYIEGLRDEVERIFRTKCASFRGNPVHYALMMDDDGQRAKVLDILTSSLLDQGRILMRRIFEVDPDSIGGMSDETFESIADLQRSGIMMVDLSKPLGDDDTLDDMYHALDTLASLVRKKRRNVLFVFMVSTAAETGWRYVRSALKDIAFVELKERALMRDEAEAFIERLACDDGMDGCRQLYNRLEAACYTAAELKTMYSSWYDNQLRSSVFPAYENLPLSEVHEVAVERGSAYRRLEGMVGLDEVRRVICDAIDYAKARTLYEKTGVAVSQMTRHMVFYGNPGTAKTTCARLYASIMKDNGLLPKGHLVEVGRKDIVSRYLGGTAPLVKEFFDKAEGGVLFIDEAYSLVEERKGFYGDEAINTIVQEMESRRQSVVVILAGYPAEMKTFLARNPGLRSRIGFHVHFRDYTAKELVSITRGFAEEVGMKLGDGVDARLVGIFDSALSHPDFGNGRYARNLFEQARLRQAGRLVHERDPDEDAIRTLIAEDFPLPAVEKVEERRTIGFRIGG